MEPILKYFHSLDPHIERQLALMEGLYRDWNSKINVISRKDMDNFYLHHVLHSLTITGFIKIPDRSEILDIGTGGGFPGIPLAILLPECRFTLVDSIAKKTMVAESVAAELGLKNVTVIAGRAEEIKSKFDFVVARAVAPFGTLLSWTGGKIKKGGAGGFVFLKGGDLSEELENYKTRVRVFELTSQFPEPFFEGKKIVFMPA